MPEKMRSFEMRLVIFIGNRISGPSSLGTWAHHSPSQLTGTKFASIMGFDGDLKPDTRLRLFHLGKRRFLEDDITYEDQEVGPQDTVVLTDKDDTAELEELIVFILKMREDKTKTRPRTDSSKFDQLLEDF